MKRITILLLLLLFITTGAYAEEEHYNFEFAKGTTLNTALYSIAYRGGREIVVNIDADKLVTMNLYQKSVDEAMDLLSKAYNFNWAIDNNTILITPADSNTQMKRFTLKNADLKLVKEELLSFVPENKLRINPEYNSISVDGTPAMLQKVKNTIAQLDAPVEQIFIMAQMIEITRTDSLKLGFEYTLPGYDNSVQPFRAQFTVTSNGLKSIDNGRILARPAITTFNGQEASLLMGDQVPVIQSSTANNGTTDSSVTFQDVGAKLKVTPYVNDKENKIITLNLEPSFSTVAKWITSGSVTAPQISTRQAKTKVRVKSGESIVIGGLMRQSDIESLKGIPGLMKLPILGKLFQSREKSKEQSEVFFVVTPYLLDDSTTLETLQKMVKDDKKPDKKPDTPIETPKAATETVTVEEPVSVPPTPPIAEPESAKIEVIPTV
jgi:type IV pilus assembly protein PilQ